jgi:hypothetical protein
MKIPDWTPTYKVSFYGIRCYLSEDGEMYGVNCLCDKLIPIAVCLHNLMSDITATLLPSWESKGFPLRILEDYKGK